MYFVFISIILSVKVNEKSEAINNEFVEQTDYLSTMPRSSCHDKHDMHQGNLKLPDIVSVP